MEIREEFEKKCLVGWRNEIKSIFPASVPNKCEWTDIGYIVSILNGLGNRTSNHMMLPVSGGYDLTESKIALEEGCIALYSGESFDIVKPKKLIFRSFGEDYSYDYFRLETDGLKETGINDGCLEFEELTYLSDGTYLERSCWDEGYYIGNDGNEKNFTNEDAVISRYIKPASFMIVAKTSLYNKIPETYNGYHDTMTDEGLYKQLEKIKASQK